MSDAFVDLPHSKLATVDGDDEDYAKNKNNSNISNLVILL